MNNSMNYKLKSINEDFQVTEVSLMPSFAQKGAKKFTYIWLQKSGFTTFEATEQIDPSRGGGDRFQKPGTKGSDQVRLEKGNPNNSDPVKRGPYGRISENGKTSEPIPLKGNPTLNE